MITAPVLDPSAARAATVELYAASRPAVAMEGLTTAQLVELIGDCRAGIGTYEAVQTLAVARLAAREDVVREDGTVAEVNQGLGYRRLDAPDLISHTLGLSSGQAGDKVDEAVVLACKRPGLVDAMGAGRVDAYRAGIIATELRDAPRAVCDQVLDRIDGWLAKPGWVLRQRTRRALEVLDKDCLITKTRRARSALGLRMVPNEDSTDTWTAILPTEQSRQAWAAVEPLAKAIRDADGCTLDVARAKAMTQLMLGNCTGTFHIHFAVPTDQTEDFAARFTDEPAPAHPTSGDATVTPADAGGPPEDATSDPDAGADQPSTTEAADPPTDARRNDIGSRSGVPAEADPVAGEGTAAPAGSDEEWAVVTGMGASGTTVVPRSWLAEVLDGQHGTVDADIIGCDPVTGGFTTDPIPIPDPRSPRGRRRPMPTLVTKFYHPTTACREYVKARDQRCRFPGCTVSAYFTDLDHVRPWPAGPTDPGNLACLCRRHHRIKQRPGWTVRLHPDGSMDWTDPTGTTRTTLPVDHLGAGRLRDAQDAAGESRNGATGFGDVVWRGDYWNPAAYAGGTPLWLHIHRDIIRMRHEITLRTSSCYAADEEPVQPDWLDEEAPFMDDASRRY